jgi:hypothetical protein
VKSAELVIAANTVWIVVAAVLVIFMQAGFALLDAGLTRMKNAAHGMAGVWDTLACGLFAAPELVRITATGSEGLAYGGGFHQLGEQVLGLAVVAAFTFTASFATLFALDRLRGGIRVGAGDGDRRAGRPRARACGGTRRCPSRCRAGTARGPRTRRPAHRRRRRVTRRRVHVPVPAPVPVPVPAED